MTKCDPTIRQRPSKWRDIVLVCRKCTKRVGGGFGPRKRTPLVKALRKQYSIAKGRRGLVGLVETGCFGICPKKAVTVARGGAPGALYVVPRGTPLADIADLLCLGALLEEEQAAGAETAKP